MSGANVLGYDNNKVSVSVMENATVEIVLGEYFNSLIDNHPDQKDSINEIFHSMVSSVLKISPESVQYGDLQSVTDLCVRVLGIQNKDLEDFQTLLNSLNLCVVGLGTKVRGKLYA